MTDVYTQTLASGYTLVIPTQADFGDIIIAGVLAALLAVLTLDLILQVVHHERHS